MTKRPTDMPERPDHADDALTELFRAVRFTRCIYYTMEGVPPPAPIHVPEGTAIAGGLGARTRTVLSYHVVVEGTLFTGLEAGEVVKLEPGDVVVYPRRDTYFLAQANAAFPPADDPAKLRGLLAGVASGALPPAFVFGDGENRMRIVCGFLGCDPRPFDP
ncbi:MAG TPA: cupin domain-containing protein, partial [Polyangiaceae bacterium]